MTYEYAYDFQEANRADLVELCYKLELEVNDFSYPPMAKCPFHVDKNKPNMALYQQPFGKYKGPHYKCFTCGAKGSPIDLVVGVQGVKPWEAARFILGRRSNEGSPKKTRRVRHQNGESVQGHDSRRQDHFSQAAQLAHERLVSNSGREARAYLSRRGLLDIALEYRFGLWWNDDGTRWSGRLVIPYPARISTGPRSLGAAHCQENNGDAPKTLEIPAAGYPEGYAISHLKGRDLTGMSMVKYLCSPGSRNIPYLLDAALGLAKQCGHLLITEGELDCLTVKLLLGNSTPVIGLPGITALAHQEDLAAQFQGLDIFLIVDNDKAGMDYIEPYRALLLRQGAHSVRALVAEPVRPKFDLNDMLVHFGADETATWLIDRMR
jgi:DNA primase